MASKGKEGTTLFSAWIDSELVVEFKVWCLKNHTRQNEACDTAFREFLASREKDSKDE